MSYPTINPHRIHLRGDGDHQEAEAATVITPGELIALDSNGKVKRHDSVGGYAEKLFAMEDSLQGKSITDDYAIGDRVSHIVAEPGDVVYARLAAGEAVTPEDFLSSAGNGLLKKSTGTDKPLLKPLDTLSLAHSNAVHTHIRARVI